MLNLLAETVTNDMGTITKSITALFGDFSVTNLVTLVGAALGITVGLFLFWFAFKWVKGKIVSALKKGRV